MKSLLVLISLFFTLHALQPKFLMPEEAFMPHAKMDTAHNIIARVELAKDIYLYEQSVSFALQGAEALTIAAIKKPKSVMHHDEMVYLESPEFIIELASTSKEMQKATLVMKYQGCSEQGLCYEPLEQTFEFEIDGAKLANKQAALPPLEEKRDSSPTENLSQTDSIAAQIDNQSFMITILSFLGFGLLLALTPCTFPMIPIISGIIIAQGHGITTKRAFFLSLVYVLAMALAYTIAGVLAGLFGSNLQAALQTPWVIFSFAAIFIALAMSMFGYYELKLPDSVVSKVSSSQNSKGGTIGVAIMGFLSALIVGPCVAAPLAGALVYIGQSGDAVLGGAALFAMSIGMGIPLLLVGVSAGKFMPRPGEWMTMVNAIFGVMMLALAIWMLERVVDIYYIMLLSAMLGFGFAIYLGAFKDTHIFKRSVAVILFLYSLILFIGALGGSKSFTQPLDFLRSNAPIMGVSVEKGLQFEVVTTPEMLDKMLQEFRGKKVMLDFYATWCASCKELEAITFKDSRVQSALEEYKLIKVDITANQAEQKALSKKYGVFGPPVLLFLDENANEIASKRIVGYIEPEAFVAHLTK